MTHRIRSGKKNTQEEVISGEVKAVYQGLKGASDAVFGMISGALARAASAVAAGIAAAEGQGTGGGEDGPVRELLVSSLKELAREREIEESYLDVSGLTGCCRKR